ncbi:unnamed protein product [Adineta steineri]|uniref:Uncharacterized protein n=1 Tax=Adineta steineri TaxID=433720 RepID=A0A819WQS9_9BILA|nr:unnamed protein product [Adineta steineri]
MLCANNIDKAIGIVVHTEVLNEQRGYENNCSVIRLGEYQQYALCVYDMLVKQDKDYGIINTGYFTQRTLRIERMYPSWGHDIDKKTTPFHLISMVIEILSGEPIYRNGEFCGFFTSTTYGFTIRKQFCLGFVDALSSEKITVNYIRRATYEIDIATKRFKACPNVYQPTAMDPTVLLYTN